MEKLKNKILKITGTTLLSIGTAVASSYCVTKYLLKLAMDRQMPKSGKKAGKVISGKKDDKAFIQALNQASDLLENSCWKKVEIIADDGIKLVGHWIPCQNPERIIIAMHGWRSSWHRDFGLVSKSWKNHNCSVLYVEQRGQNDSEGDYIGFGLRERYDCVNWIKWVIENQGEDIPIYLAGVSMGATSVLFASELNLPECVHGIIADCGFTSPDAIWKHITIHNLHLSYGIKRKMANTIFRKKTKEDSDMYSTEDINADKIACVDEDCLANGKFQSVEDSPFDFRNMHKIGDHIDDDDIQLKNANGYDHSFLLNKGSEQVILYDESSGRKLIITTSCPTMQLYTGNFLSDGCMAKKGIIYQDGDGVALETQLLPNSIKIEENPSVILREGEEYKAFTKWVFDIVN